MAVSRPAPPAARPALFIWLLPVLLLCCVYGLLGLTLTHTLSHHEIMERCVLVSPDLARIWSVGNVEIGLAYMGVFGGMGFYLLRASKVDPTHLTDLGLGLAYLFFSFILDFLCVRYFSPFVALLIGDAIVMTFTLVVSRQLWFQRLLGIFVPLVFFTCALGHFMEGLSYWQLTYPVNVPWTMVTADIGFAILVNAARYPAFIRGQDVINEMEGVKAEASLRQTFFRDVLRSATGGRLNLCGAPEELPPPLPHASEPIPLTQETLRRVRQQVKEAAQSRHFSQEQVDDFVTAVAEASLNAIVHGHGGECVLRATADDLQAWVSDRGRGMTLAQMPRALLDHAFETKDPAQRGFAGQGFWLMLRTADRLDLYTGAQGTTVVLTALRRTHSQEMPTPILEAISP